MRNHQKWEEIQEKCDRGFKNWKLGEGSKTCESLGRKKVGEYDDNACVHNNVHNEKDFPVCCGRTRLNVSQVVSANISGDLTHGLTAD